MNLKIVIQSVVLCTLFLVSLQSHAKDYVFGWPFLESEAMQPRGGSTTGPEVTLASEPSETFESIRQSEISDFERDRRAILSMSGPYRVSFDFLEVAVFEGDFQPAAPYRSWGTEYVYVIEDEGDYISLQHVLVMTVIDDEGVSHGPFTTKHWRQDWHYQPESAHLYQGDNLWEEQSIPEDVRSGHWAQTVWQVDDSPRYAGWGQWSHHPTFSNWNSNTTWRPLPRREYAARDDYDVLVGENHHTVTADGWIHEEHNNKVVLETTGSEPKSIAREYGIARYQRIEGHDFSPGDQYIESTAEFWGAVRRYWSEIYAENKVIQLEEPIDQAGLFMPLFERAQQIADGDFFDEEANLSLINSTIDGFMAE